MKQFIFSLLVLCDVASPVLHSLKYFYTASSGVPNFPEFVAVGMVDELQIDYYDSNTQRTQPKQDWMDKVTTDEPQYWEGETGNLMNAQQVFKVSIDTLKKRFNQTGDRHIYQWMYGCEWDDETGAIDGYDQYGYDGEDFIVFDLKMMSWIAPSQEAFITKLRWDKDKALLENRKYYYTELCIMWLKKYLKYGKETLQRTVPPSVSLLQKSPSSPVACHATGFYPDGVMVFWTRDGEELHEEVEHGELLPNPDGTFQISAELSLASVRPEDWGRYACVLQLHGLRDDIITPLESGRIRSNRAKASSVGVAVGVVAAVVVVMVLVAAGVALYKKKNEREKCLPPGSDNSSELSEKLNPPPDVSVEN